VNIRHKWIPTIKDACNYQRCMSVMENSNHLARQRRQQPPGAGQRQAQPREHDGDACYHGAEFGGVLVQLKQRDRCQRLILRDLRWVLSELKKGKRCGQKVDWLWVCSMADPGAAFFVLSAPQRRPSPAAAPRTACGPPSGASRAPAGTGTCGGRSWAASTARCTRPPGAAAYGHVGGRISRDSVWMWRRSGGSAAGALGPCHVVPPTANNVLVLGAALQECKGTCRGGCC